MSRAATRCALALSCSLVPLSATATEEALPLDLLEFLADHVEREDGTLVDPMTLISGNPEHNEVDKPSPVGDAQ